MIKNLIILKIPMIIATVLATVPRWCHVKAETGGARAGSSEGQHRRALLQGQRAAAGAIFAVKNFCRMKN